MKLATWLVLGGLGVGWLGACGKASSGDEVGGETHWLKHCGGTGESEVECGPDLDCVCGVCTAACDEASACGELSSEARCSRPSETEFASACATAVPERICVRAQTDVPDASVAYQIEGMRYDAANDCLEPLASAGIRQTDGSPVSCDDALTYGLRGDECWQFPSSCLPDGFTPVTLALVSGPCFTAGACQDTVTCAGGEIATIEGRLSCDEAEGRLWQSVPEFVEAAGFDRCNTDLDCVLQDWSTECRYACPVAVAADTAPSLTTALPDVTSGYCNPVEWLATCGGPPSLECGPSAAFCRDGRCVVGQGPPCAERQLESCDFDGNCALARAFPFDTDQQCFAGASVEVGCVDPDLSCPPVTTAALDGEGSCFMFGGCLTEGFTRAPSEHACTLANGTTCAP